MSSNPSGFEKHARTVTGLTVVSRMGGLLRDATMSRVFGISPLMDAFAFGFQVPNLFRRLFGEGVLSAAFLPEYTRLSDDDPATAALMARLLVGRSIMLLSGIVLLIEMLLLFGVLDGLREAQGLRLLAIMLPYAPMVCLVALMGAMLQAHGRFGPTAAAPIIMNLFFVASTLLLLPLVSSGRLTSEAQISWVAASLLLAGMIQVFWSWRALRALPSPPGVADRAVARATSFRGHPCRTADGARTWCSSVEHPAGWTHRELAHARRSDGAVYRCRVPAERGFDGGSELRGATL